MYKLIKEGQAVQRLLNGALIPFDKDNTDYQQFKKDLANGVELKDADGNTMDAAQVATFLSTLP